MSSTITRKRRRSHSLGGCVACRRRHIKCDQSRPTCLMCRTSGLSCEAYDSRIVWIGQLEDATVLTSKPRKHLYPESSRALMSQILTSQVLGNIDDSLTEIDVGSTQLQQPGNITVGPFQVLRLDGAPSMADNVAQQPLLDANYEPFLDLDQSLQWSDLFEFNIDSFALSNQQPIDAEALLQPLAPTSQLVQLSTPPFNIPDVAPILLENFRAQVIPNMAGLPFKKSPWLQLNLAAAVETLARMTYLTMDINQANMANFYAILACSAYNLAQNAPHQWSAIQSTTSGQAKMHLQNSLQKETVGCQKAKYKEQLMAVLSCTTYAVISGKQGDARSHLLDAERLLRSRGLSKVVVSRRARLLHHIYTWARIIGESTYVLHDQQMQDANATLPPPSAQPVQHIKMDDFLRLEPRWDDIDMQDPKEPSAAVLDIHLDDPRQSPATLFFQIYGVPETWLSLVSQTIRMANAMQHLRRQNRDPGNDIHESLKERAQELENRVCVCAAACAAEEGESRTASSYMLTALTSTLVIYFYRRIRKVNPWILQGHVDSVISALNSFDKMLTQQNQLGPGSAWPAFIAGCEALTQKRRDFFERWMRNAALKTGFSCHETAAEVMSQAWTQRNNLAASPEGLKAGAVTDDTWTWEHICQDRNLWVMLC